MRQESGSVAADVLLPESAGFSGSHRYLYFLLALLAACSSTQAPAPISEGTSSRPALRSPLAVKPPAPVAAGYYRVQPGDTLFKIAFELGQDASDLATWNKLADPGRIRSGDVLRVQPPPQSAVSTRTLPTATPVAVRALPTTPAVTTRALPPAPTAVSRAPSPPSPVAKPVAVPVRAAAAAPPVVVKPVSAAPPPEPEVDDDAVPDIWSWPARGPILARFGEGLSKGIDIAGPRGMPVQAAAPGRVVYAGSGLRGYGKLIIIRHGKTLLSAYAHNSRILVAEGQNVIRGQAVGELGDSDADRVKLHFEIREFGKPVDPMNYLPDAG